MDLVLKRTHSLEYGIFGILYDSNVKKIAVTIEHAYSGASFGEWKSKIPLGTYVCKRSEHHLRAQPNPFETFEVTGIKGHSGIVFHVGNRNNDSEGCILIGTGFDNLECPRAITSSRLAFSMFMVLQDGDDSFKLRVE